MTHKIILTPTQADKEGVSYNDIYLENKKHCKNLYAYIKRMSNPRGYHIFELYYNIMGTREVREYKQVMNKIKYVSPLITIPGKSKYNVTDKDKIENMLSLVLSNTKKIRGKKTGREENVRLLREKLLPKKVET